MLFVLLTLATSALKRYPGIKWTRPGASIVIEVYVDPLCPDCLEIWPKIKSVLDHYPSQVNVSAILLNLPYHTWSYYVVKACYALYAYSNDLGRQFIDALYEGEQNQFSNAALSDVPEAQITERVLQYICKKYSIDYDKLYSYFTSSDVASPSAYGQYFAGIHGVDGTPTVFINGVMTDLSPETPVTTWYSVIDGLL